MEPQALLLLLDEALISSHYSCCQRGSGYRPLSMDFTHREWSYHGSLPIRPSLFHISHLGIQRPSKMCSIVSTCVRLLTMLLQVTDLSLLDLRCNVGGSTAVAATATTTAGSTVGYSFSYILFWVCSRKLSVRSALSWTKQYIMR